MCVFFITTFGIKNWLSNQYCRNDFLFCHLNFLFIFCCDKTLIWFHSAIQWGRNFGNRREISFRKLGNDFFQEIGKIQLFGRYQCSVWVIFQVRGLKSNHFSVILEEKFLFWDWKSYRRNSSNFILKQLNFFCEFREQQYSLTCDNFQGYWSRGKNWFFAKENVTFKVSLYNHPFSRVRALNAAALSWGYEKKIGKENLICQEYIFRTIQNWVDGGQTLCILCKVLLHYFGGISK